MISARWWRFIEKGEGRREAVAASPGEAAEVRENRDYPEGTKPSADGPRIRCGMCVHACILALGRSGYCGVRRHEAGGLVSPFLGRFTSLAVDPIEKKPLYHWMPGTRIFSLGSVGCTMRCPFCQNHNIAQPAAAPGKGPMLPSLTALPVRELVPAIRNLGVPSVAFTYNEPTLQAEYIVEAGPLLREAGIAVALVTNGMMSHDVLEDLAPWVDALNVDVKTFNQRAYRRMGGSLERMRATVEYLVRAGKHVELTTLVVPGISDGEEDCARMVEWIAGLSPGIPLHFSRYFPAHIYTAPATEPAVLERMKQIAEARLTHVHLGNVGKRP